MKYLKTLVETDGIGYKLVRHLRPTKVVFAIGLTTLHYENLPMQYLEIFSVVNNKNLAGKIFIVFSFLLKTLIVGTC